MKLTKKKVFVAALAVSLVAILSMGTLAWFNAQDDVTNKFYIASSEDVNPDDIFSIDVWENTPDSDKNQEDYEYKDILPGDVLKKEVNVENTGYYDQYVRVTVTVSDAQAWMDALNVTEAPRLDAIVEGFDYNANIWVDNEREVVGDNIVYTMYLNKILDGSDEGEGTNTVSVFTAVKIPQSLTVEQAAAFKNNFEISVKAEAVQTENLGLVASNGDGAEEAFAVVEGN